MNLRLQNVVGNSIPSGIQSRNTIFGCVRRMHSTMSPAYYQQSNCVHSLGSCPFSMSSFVYRYHRRHQYKYVYTTAHIETRKD